MVIVSIAAIVAGTAALLGNLETIQKYFRTAPVLPTAPPITVRLTNTGATEINVAARGDFMLWLPGIDGMHTVGKYEFRDMDGNLAGGSAQITVGPNETVEVVAHILNQNAFGRILEQGDCDISLLIGREGRGIKFTDNLAFTKTAIEKYYVSVDVGAN